MEARLNLLPQKWRFVLESLQDIRRQIAAENGGNFQNAGKTAETPVVSTVSDVCSHFDPSVLADFPGEAPEKSQYLQGFPGRSHFDASVPISVRRPFSSSKGMAYRWER